MTPITFLTNKKKFIIFIFQDAEALKHWDLGVVLRILHRMGGWARDPKWPLERGEPGGQVCHSGKAEPR